MTNNDYLIYEHGFNGDFPFTEVVDLAGTLDEAKRIGYRVMRTDRFENVLDDGTPTVRWVEIFGPEFEESLGIEERDGELVEEGR